MGTAVDIQLLKHDLQVVFHRALRDVQGGGQLPIPHQILVPGGGDDLMGLFQKAGVFGKGCPRKEA